MARPSRRVVCDEATKAWLLEIAASRKQQSGLSLRVRIILQCLDSRPVKEVAENCGVSVVTVIRWKNRFIAAGMAGLSDQDRSGRPAVYQEEFKQAVLEKLEQAPPDGLGQWNGALLAQELGYSKHAIWRLLREQRISLARRRSWCINTDLEFVPKAADVVGLYLTRDEKALVICVDENPQTQEFRTGDAVGADRKLIRGLESAYKHPGTVNLFAALEIAAGKIHGKATGSSQKNQKDFLAFMDELLLVLPGAEEYHVILYNHSIHKQHELWLEKNENVFFHYTPTSAGWLNMVEIWLGILTRKSSSFASSTALCGHIRQFIESYNQSVKPFVWKKREIKGVQLANNICNFCN